jgi:transcription elongation factor Elf1
MEVFDTSYTDLITCPWCGHEEKDSWEISDGEFECGECDKTYEVYHDVSITYSTAKVIKIDKSEEK